MKNSCTKMQYFSFKITSSNSPGDSPVWEINKVIPSVVKPMEHTISIYSQIY